MLPTRIENFKQQHKFTNINLHKLNCTIALIFSAYRNYWALDARVRRWTQDAGLWTLDSGRRTLGSGCWTLDAGRWTLDAGLWTLAAGRWTPILRTVRILYSQSQRVSQRQNDTLIILQTKTALTVSLLLGNTTQRNKT